MVFNDETNKQGLIQDIDFLLFGKGDVFNDNYSLEDRTRNINIMYDEAVIELLKADPNWQWDDKNSNKLPIVWGDLQGGRDHYTFPVDLSIIHRLRVKNKQGNFTTLTPVSRRELSDTQLKSKGTPHCYYKLDNSVFTVPVPDYSSTKGIEIQIQRGAEHFNINDTDKEPGFQGKFHQYLSVGAALRYALANNMDNKAQNLSVIKEGIKADMNAFYERRAKDKMPNLETEKRNIKHFGL